jgi:hypothetical protein
MGVAIVGFVLPRGVRQVYTVNVLALGVAQLVVEAGKVCVFHRCETVDSVWSPLCL